MWRVMLHDFYTTDIQFLGETQKEEKDKQFDFVFQTQLPAVRNKQLSGSCCKCGISLSLSLEFNANLIFIKPSRLK